MLYTHRFSGRVSFTLIPEMDTHRDDPTDLKMKESKTVENQHHTTAQKCPRWDNQILSKKEIIFDKIKFQFHFLSIGPTLKGVIDSGKRIFLSQEKSEGYKTHSLRSHIICKSLSNFKDVRVLTIGCNILNVLLW